MSVILGRGAGHCFPILLFNARHVPWFQVVKVLEWTARPVGIVRLPISYVLKLYGPPDDMPESFLECLSPVTLYGGPVGQNLLKPGRPWLSRLKMK